MSYSRMARAATCTAIVAFMSPSAAYAQPPLSSCRVAGVDVRCGTVNVPEDRTNGARGRNIGLRVFVLPSANPTNGPPLFVVNGGPGAPTVGMAQLFFDDWATLRANREIVLIDQRGTGGSNALACEPDHERAIVPKDAAQCISLLSRLANLHFYGTEDAARDIDAVRAVLGYDQIDVLGISYGTRVAWYYAKTFPTRLRAVVMLSPNPPSQRLMESVGEDTRRAVSLLVADCRADHDCRTRFPGFEEDLKTVTETLTHRQLVALPLLLYSVDGVRRLPWMVSQAGSGDRRPLERALGSALTGGQQQISLGLHLTIQCSEEFGISRLIEDDRLAAALWNEYATACRGWPRIPVPHGFRDSFTSTARAFVISGEWDPATPPRSAEETARLFSDARVEIIAKGTHGLSQIGECLGRVVAQFLDGRLLETGCLNSLASHQYFAPDSAN